MTKQSYWAVGTKLPKFPRLEKDLKVDVAVVGGGITGVTAAYLLKKAATPAHEPILWRHVSWNRQSPDREMKETSRWGWLFYRRVKTGKNRKGTFKILWSERKKTAV